MALISATKPHSWPFLAPLGIAILVAITARAMAATALNTLDTARRFAAGPASAAEQHSLLSEKGTRFFHTVDSNADSKLDENVWQDILAGLDSTRAGIRAQAEQRLRQMRADPSVAGCLDEYVRRSLWRTDLSYETRRILASLQPLDQPSGKAAPEQASASSTPDQPPRLSKAEVRQEIEALLDDHFARRAAARHRLAVAFRNPSSCAAAIDAMRSIIRGSELDLAAIREIRNAWEAALAGWVVASQPEPRLEEWSRGELVECLERLTAAVNSASALAPERAALSVLHFECALADPLGLAVAVDVLQEWSDRSISPEVRPVIEQLREWTKPAMVAEYWSEGRHLGEQHMLVGVPSQVPGAARPSHFARIDDRWAECVSGNSLSPGQYPTHVAIPHPMSESAFFHLVNLPTPRRRLAYRYTSKLDDSRRLVEISRRTIDRFLDPPRPLTEPETVLLGLLDPAEVGRFVEKYFFQVEDGPFNQSDPAQPRLGGRPSRLGLVCAILAKKGDRRSLSGLMRAIAQGRFRPPTSDCPYRMEYVALIAVAGRDGRDDALRCLIEIVDNCSNLAEDGRAAPPEVGPTAAAVVLKHVRTDPIEFGLVRVNDSVLESVGVEGYRSTTPDYIDRFRQWWRTRQSIP